MNDLALKDIVNAYYDGRDLGLDCKPYKNPYPMGTEEHRRFADGWRYGVQKFYNAHGEDWKCQLG